MHPQIWLHASEIRERERERERELSLIFQIAGAFASRGMQYIDSVLVIIKLIKGHACITRTVGYIVLGYDDIF